jgi:hypothetical protein
MRPYGRPLVGYPQTPARLAEAERRMDEFFSNFRFRGLKMAKSKKTKSDEPELDPILAELAKKHAKDFQAAKKRAMEEGGITDYDDGIYIFVFNGFEFSKSKASNRPQLALEWKFAEGEYEGKTTRRFYGLETQDNMFWLNNDLMKLGYEPPEDPAGLMTVCRELMESKPKIKAALGTRNDFQNMRIKKVLEESTAGGDETTEIDLDEMDKDELLALIKENELEIEGKPKKMKEKELRKAIKAALESGEEEEDEESEEEEEDEEEGEEEEEEEEEEKTSSKKKSDKEKSSKAKDEEEEEEEEDEEESEEEEEEDEEGEEEEEEEVIVDKGDTVKFPLDGKKAKGEVTKVDHKNGTCTIKHTKTGKLIKGVAVDSVTVLDE